MGICVTLLTYDRSLKPAGVGGTCAAKVPYVGTLKVIAEVFEARVHRFSMHHQNNSP